MFGEQIDSDETFKLPGQEKESETSDDEASSDDSDSD
jgi:hypothetical protein